jgi:hypothetical protein
MSASLSSPVRKNVHETRMCRIDRLFPATLVANTFVVRMTEPRPNFCIQSEFRDTNDWRARNGHHLPQIDTASNRLDVARSQNGYSDGPTKPWAAANLSASAFAAAATRNVHSLDCGEGLLHCEDHIGSAQPCGRCVDVARRQRSSRIGYRCAPAKFISTHSGQGLPSESGSMPVDTGASVCWRSADTAAGKPRHSLIEPSPQPADSAHNPVSHRPGCGMILYLGIVQLQHQARIWEYRDADVVEGHVTASGRAVRINPE